MHHAVSYEAGRFTLGQRSDGRALFAFPMRYCNVIIKIQCVDRRDEHALTLFCLLRLRLCNLWACWSCTPCPNRRVGLTCSPCAHTAKSRIKAFACRRCWVPCTEQKESFLHAQSQST